MHTINTDQIKPLAYATEQYKVRNAYKLGQFHARNHFHGEEPDPYWGPEVKSWAVVPYTEERPAVFYSFLGGFHEEWSRLLNEEKES